MVRVLGVVGAMVIGGIVGVVWGWRTQDPYIKSVLLYQLSYQIIANAGANICVIFFYARGNSVFFLFFLECLIE